MSKLKIDAERCKSCGYCVASCPKKALSFVRDEGNCMTQWLWMMRDASAVEFVIVFVQIMYLKLRNKEVFGIE